MFTVICGVRAHIPGRSVEIAEILQPRIAHYQCRGELEESDIGCCPRLITISQLVVDLTGPDGGYRAGAGP